MTVQIIPVFPSLILATQVENFEDIKEDLISWIKDYQNTQDNQQVSGRNAWQSSKNFFKKEKSFFKYKNIIEKSISQVMMSFTDSKYKIASMWININNPGGYNISHVHPDSDLSGVFWIDIPKNSGKLHFESPNSFSQYKLIQSCKQNIKESLNYYDDFWLDSEDGKLIIFSSDLRHLVETNKSSQNRISISFNISILT